MTYKMTIFNKRWSDTPDDAIDKLARNQWGLKASDGTPPHTPHCVDAVEAHGLRGHVVALGGSGTLHLAETALGSGSLGSVMPAIREPTRDLVAVKRISHKHARPAEIQADAILAHLSLAASAPMEIWETSSDSFMVMPYFPTSLANLGAPLEATHSEALAVTFLLDILPSLASLHHNGLGHGDLKLENVMYRSSRMALVDFELQRSNQLSFRPRKFCTHYMLSPECFSAGLADGNVMRLDVWCAGLSAFELAAGTCGREAMKLRWTEQAILQGTQNACRVLEQMGGLTGEGLAGDSQARKLWRTPLAQVSPTLRPILDAALDPNPLTRPGAAALLAQIHAAYPDSMLPRDPDQPNTRAYLVAEALSSRVQTRLNQLHGAIIPLLSKRY